MAAHVYTEKCQGTDPTLDKLIQYLDECSPEEAQAMKSFGHVGTVPERAVLVMPPGFVSGEVVLNNFPVLGCRMSFMFGSSSVVKNYTALLKSLTSGTGVLSEDAERAKVLLITVEGMLTKLPALTAGASSAIVLVEAKAAEGAAVVMA